MKVCVSACLLGCNCKYNGGNNLNDKVVRFVKGKDVVPVCPEQLGGLPTPRTPSEIVNGRVTTKDGKDVDAAFRRGALLAAQEAVSAGVELAILKSRSPSCGAKQIYDGTFTGTLVDGKGVFAQALAERGIPIIDEADDSLLV